MMGSALNSRRRRSPMGSVRAVRYRPQVPGDAAMLPCSHRRLSGTFSFGLPPVHTEEAWATAEQFHCLLFHNCLSAGVLVVQVNSLTTDDCLYIEENGAYGEEQSWVRSSSDPWQEFF